MLRIRDSFLDLQSVVMQRFEQMCRCLSATRYAAQYPVNIHVRSFSLLHVLCDYYSGAALAIRVTGFILGNPEGN